MIIILGSSCGVCGSEDRLVEVSPPFLFSCWKTCGKYDNFSQTWLRMLLVNRTGCVKLEMHFPLASHSPKDALAERRHMLNYHGNSFLFCPSCSVLHGQPQPGTHAGSGRSQPVFWGDCGALRLHIRGTRNPMAAWWEGEVVMAVQAPATVLVALARSVS